ncbi:hypothetical protein G6011_02643 [Alternaria panax]|uniref:Protein kinase domain-containing protein n=1 Tax=Alternaria panax TaxID=48097 RepID=A0AAD4I5H7_9PLEO|nr:hypothetical protein G6011_02643 [Alternaria panax]
MPLKSNCLLVPHDTTGLIEEQITLKIVDLTANDDIPHFHDREIKIYDLLRSTGCSHVIGYRAYRFSMQSSEGCTITPERPDKIPGLWETSYIYTDYAAMGDLVDACKAHKEHRMYPIVRFDIKAANVFLHSSSEEFPLWPRAILSDFDTAVRLEPDDGVRSAQPEASRQTGTDGWLPPERNVRARGNSGNLLLPSTYPPHGWALSEKTGIWDIVVLACVLTRAHKIDADLEAKCRNAGCSYLYNEGQGACQYTSRDAKLWKADLRNRNVFSDETACPPPENLSDEYDLRLYKQIQASVKDKKDRLYAFFNVHPKTDKLEDFSVGAPYRSPHEQRKIDLADTIADDYKDAINSWDDEGLYTRPTVDEQAAVSQSVENFY